MLNSLIEFIAQEDVGFALLLCVVVFSIALCAWSVAKLVGVLP